MTTSFEQFKDKCVEKYREELVYRDLAYRLERFVGLGPLGMQAILVRTYLAPMIDLDIEMDFMYACAAIGRFVARETPGFERFKESARYLGEFIGNEVRGIAARKLVYPIVNSLKESQEVLPPGLTGHEQVTFLRTWRTCGQTSSQALELFYPLGWALWGNAAVLDLFQEGNLLSALRQEGEPIDDDGSY